MPREIKCAYPRRLNAEMLECLPPARYAGKTDVVENPEDLDGALALLKREKLLGFDTETRPSFDGKTRYKVSVLQLAGENRVWIFRLIPLEKRLGELFKILEDPGITKAGIAVKGDIDSLKRLEGFSPAGFEDVADFARKLGLVNTGMKSLCALLFGEKVSKGARLSNWEKKVLDPRQTAYAATDAWVSRRLYLEFKSVLEGGRAVLEEPPPPPLRERIFNFLRGALGRLKKTKKRLSKLSGKYAREKTRPLLLEFKRLAGERISGEKGKRRRGKRKRSNAPKAGEAPRKSAETPPPTAKGAPVPRAPSPVYFSASDEKKK